MSEGVRIDKWLWAVRLFKTRSQASEACKSGKIVIDKIKVKPSREIKIGDTIVISQPLLVRTVKIKELLENRVSAKLVASYLDDLTPAEEYSKQKIKHEMNFEVREHGLGRPTKKERRLIDQLKRTKF
jgi:ribosome-associated heat shock protein Hsp15